LNNLESTENNTKQVSHSRNSFYSLLSWLLPLGLTFLATPYIVRGLGSEQYGLYALMIGFIAYSFTFNIGKAITKYVAEFSARGETEKISQTISATFFLSLTVATIGSLALAAAANFLVEDVLQIQTAAREETVYALYLAALSIWLLIVGQIFSAVVQAAHRFDVFSIITTLTNAGLILGNLALVWLGFKFYHLVLWNALTIALSGTAFFYFAKKLQPETKINFNFDKRIFSLTAKYSINVAGYQIFGNLLFICERIVITRFRGAEDLAYYAVPMTVAIYISAFISSFTMNFVAFTSEFTARNQLRELENVYRKATKIVVALVVFLCVSLSVAAKPILANWIDSQFAEAASGVFVIQIIIFSLMACLIVAWQFIEGFGQPVYNLLFSLFWLIISAPLMLILTRRFGIEGTALARLAGELTIPVFIVLIERKIFGKVLWNLWAKIMLLIGLAAFAAGSAEYFILNFFTNHWLTIFGAVSVSGLIYLSVVWLTNYFSTDEKFWIKEKLTKSFNR
jgi:O-antigen/teichoic acid export membrane protein